MPEISIVVPTFNESENIGQLHARLVQTMGATSWEMIVVDDDSPDGTADLVREIAQTDPRVRCLQRLGRRGLSTAVVEGVMSSASPVLAVMDADLQHDEKILPVMLERLRSEGLDVIVGSRYMEGGSTGDWDESRKLISRFAGSLSRGLVPADLHDPMSGFFMVKAQVMREAVRHLSGYGYKILLDLFASAGRPLRFAEVAYTFRPRTHGASKLDTLVAWEYLMLLLDKRIGHVIPPRLLFFALVGGSGMLIHFGILGTAVAGGVTFIIAQSAAVVAAMTWNFALNNILTYRDKRLHGWRFLRGLISFYAVCGVGALANIGVANYAYSKILQREGLAPSNVDVKLALLSGAAGIVVGTLWNYLATARFTWGGAGRPRGH